MVAISRAAAENITSVKLAFPAGERDLPLICVEAKKCAHPESVRTRHLEEELLTRQQQPEYAAQVSIQSWDLTCKYAEKMSEPSRHTSVLSKRSRVSRQSSLDLDALNINLLPGCRDVSYKGRQSKGSAWLPSVTVVVVPSIDRVAVLDEVQQLRLVQICSGVFVE